MWFQERPPLILFLQLSPSGIYRSVMETSPFLTGSLPVKICRHDSSLLFGFGPLTRWVPMIYSPASSRTSEDRSSREPEPVLLGR